MSIYAATTSPTSLAAALSRNFPLYPALGIFTVVVTTTIAVNLVPADPSPLGALFWPALIMTSGLLGVALLSAVKTPKAFLRAENLVLASPIYWLLLDLLQSAYPVIGVSEETIIWEFIAIGLFALGLWAAVMVPPLALPQSVMRAATYPLWPSKIFRFIIIFFLLGMFNYAYSCNFNPLAMIEALGSDRWSAPWMRGQFGGWDSFLDHMSYFGYLLPTLTTLLANRTRWLARNTIISTILSGVFVLFLAQGGGRRLVGVVVGAAIIAWVLEQKRISLRQLIIVALLGAILLGFMQFMLEYRNDGFQALFTNEEREAHYEYLHIDDNFLRFAQIIEFVPKHHPYVYEKQIVYYIVRPIPRVFWADKPVDPGFDLPALLGEKGVSLSASALGEFYLAGGLVGVVIGGFLYGLLARMFSILLLRLELRETAATLVYSLAIMALVAGMRSLIELILMSYALIAWIVVAYVVYAGEKLRSIRAIWLNDKMQAR